MQGAGLAATVATPQSELRLAAPSAEGGPETAGELVSRPRRRCKSSLKLLPVLGGVAVLAAPRLRSTELWPSFADPAGEVKVAPWENHWTVTWKWNNCTGRARPGRAGAGGAGAGPEMSQN